MPPPPPPDQKPSPTTPLPYFTFLRSIYPHLTEYVFTGYCPSLPTETSSTDTGYFLPRTVLGTERILEKQTMLHAAQLTGGMRPNKQPQGR